MPWQRYYYCACANIAMQFCSAREFAIIILLHNSYTIDIMNYRKGSVLIIVILLFSDHLVLVHGCHDVCACCGIVGGVYSVYNVATGVLWVWRFVKYLDSYHLRSLYDIKNWLWNNPPPFGVKYYILVKVVMFFLDGKSLSVLQRHKHLKNMQCSHEHCSATREFMKLAV